ncbi:hypothetical protein AAFF_G00058620 [Aldrovandia affinis]|uniref:Uncharacterized protein n=1 Tax=Aldrovandia affinis TaxID=143900 RepID=A0AAD7WEB0_9TELE|nr:hypothetical protein AAFF_G00058620 [Aldrovandia affinis]
MPISFVPGVKRQPCQAARWHLIAARLPSRSAGAASQRLAGRPPRTPPGNSAARSRPAVAACQEAARMCRGMINPGSPRRRERVKAQPASCPPVRRAINRLIWSDGTPLRRAGRHHLCERLLGQRASFPALVSACLRDTVGKGSRLAGDLFQIPPRSE